MKRIAILSMQSVYNYGSVLQAWSLKQLLEELFECSVDFLNIERDVLIPIKERELESVDYGEYRIKMWEWPAFLVKKLNNRRLWKKYVDMISGFQRAELGLTDEANDRSYDIVIVGSDEVFKAEKRICLQMYGNIRQSEKLITYAASCGSMKYEYIREETMEQICGAVNRFKKMSVRDAGTEALMSSLYRGEIERHLDPVLVGSLRFRKPQIVKLKNYMVVYAYPERMRDKDEIAAIRGFAKNKGLKLIAIGGPQYWCDRFVPCGPFEAMDYFQSADYVVTDTFHGTIFSVINRKRFGVILRKSNSNKLSSLLEGLGLSGRRIRDMAELENTLCADIDYEKVFNILDSERERAKDYLIKSVEACLGDVE